MSPCTYNSILSSQKLRCARPVRHSPSTVYCNCCCLFQASHDAVCIQFVLSKCPDMWHTTISVMSNVNARHYTSTNISNRRDEKEQTRSLLTAQTLSQFPHFETPEIASLFLTLSTVKISTPLLRVTAVDSQFQQDSSTEKFHLLFQLAVFALTNRRLNQEVHPPSLTRNLPQKIRT